MMTKFCYKCKTDKSFDAFGKNKSKKNGYSDECKPCKKLQDRSYYTKNADKVKQSAKQYREANPEKVSQTKRNCYLKDPEKYKAMKLSWKRSNPEKMYKYGKAYKAANRGKVNSWLAKYRALRLKATPPWFEKDLVETVYIKAKEWGFAVDHVIPLQGDKVCGLHCWANLQLLDPLLNSSKSNKHWPDMP